MQYPAASLFESRLDLQCKPLIMEFPEIHLWPLQQGDIAKVAFDPNGLPPVRPERPLQ
jgi:hypothetical protein